MDLKKINQIMKNEQITDVFYENRVVWIQELNNNTAKVGFLDTSEEENVSIDDLYEI